MMNKYIILLFLILTSAPLYSQSTNYLNFKIEGNEIIWQKVIEIKTSKDEYVNNLKTKEFFINLNSNDNTIAGRTNKKDLKIKSPYWSSFPFDCFTKIEFKENRCRITISKITFDGPEIELNGVKGKYDYELSETASKKGIIKNSKKILTVLFKLNSFFENITSEIHSDKKSDW